MKRKVLIRGLEDTKIEGRGDVAKVFGKSI